jgi:hypothetical protein
MGRSPAEHQPHDSQTGGDRAAQQGNGPANVGMNTSRKPRMNSSSNVVATGVGHRLGDLWSIGQLVATG